MRQPGATGIEQRLRLKGEEVIFLFQTPGNHQSDCLKIVMSSSQNFTAFNFFPQVSPPAQKIPPISADYPKEIQRVGFLDQFININDFQLVLRKLSGQCSADALIH
jgi:hypothetical protein